MENRFLKVASVEQLLQVEVIAMFPNTVERLVERGEPLLAVKHQKGVPLPSKIGCALELARGEDTLGVAHAQQASSGIVTRDRDNQLLRRSRLPHEIALEVRQRHGA